MGVGPASLFRLYLFFGFFCCFLACEKIYKHLYIEKYQKYHQEPQTITLNFSEIYENATGGACGPRTVTVGAVKFSGEISGQQMVDSGRSEGEDSDGGGLDGS
jgi:hypothetical protein